MRIRVREATKSYGSVRALDGVSLSVAADETVGLVGTNGAGKTTLFKLLVGHETPDSGEVTVCGRSPSAGPAVRQAVGYLPERAGFAPNLTGREVLDFHARVRDVPDRERRVERVLRTVGLADAADRRVGGYSNGMHRRLGLGTTLLGNPAVLLLDEPTAGLDPRGVEAFHDVLARIDRDSDVSVVVTSHVLSEIERLCERVLVFDEGRIRARGTVAELRRDAGSTVTVTVRLGDAADADALREAVTGCEAIASVERVGAERFELRCDRGEAFETLAALRERADVDGFEVREPGLDAVFADALQGGEPA